MKNLQSEVGSFIGTVFTSNGQWKVSCFADIYTVKNGDYLRVPHPILHLGRDENRTINFHLIDGVAVIVSFR